MISGHVTGEQQRSQASCIASEFKLGKNTVVLQSMRLLPKDAWILIGASTFGLLCLFVDDNRLGFGPVGQVGTALLAAVMAVVGMLNLLPERYFLYGVELKDDGFVFHHQLRRTRFIRYESIYRIVASAMIDGTGESVCTLLVMSSDGNARLDEKILYGTEILETLKSLPGFDKQAWSDSNVPEDSLLYSTIAKRTVIFEKK